MPRKSRRPVGRPRIHQTHEDLLASRLIRQRKHFQRTSAENTNSIQELHDHNYSITEYTNRLEMMCNRYASDRSNTELDSERMKYRRNEDDEYNQRDQMMEYQHYQQESYQINLPQSHINHLNGMDLKYKFENEKPLQHLQINHEVHIKEEILDDEAYYEQLQQHHRQFSVADFEPNKMYGNGIHIKEEIVKGQEIVNVQQQQFSITEVEFKTEPSESRELNENIGCEYQYQQQQGQEHYYQQQHMTQIPTTQYECEYGQRDLVTDEQHLQQWNSNHGIHIKDEKLQDQQDNTFLEFESEHSNSNPYETLNANNRELDDLETQEPAHNRIYANSWEELMAKKRERNRRYQHEYRKRQKWRNQANLLAYQQQPLPQHIINDPQYNFKKYFLQTREKLSEEELLRRRERNRRYQSEYRQRQKLKEMQIKNMQCDYNISTNDIS